MSQPFVDSSLAKADIQLFESGDLADATIVCGELTWNVHKLILGSRCKWFKAAFYGHMQEAACGKIVLQEQDPNLVDAALRFIYAKDINIAQLCFDKDIPTFCVRIFRVADFFGLDALKAKAIKELEVFLASLSCYSLTGDGDDEESDGAEGLDYHRAWEIKLLDAVEDAYKDESTAPVLQLLLDYTYKNSHRLFRLPQALSMLDKLPNLGKDLMKNHINESITLFNKEPQFRLGLSVLAAIQSPDHFFKAGTLSSGVNTSTPCRLYQLLHGTPSSLFMPMDPETNKELQSLRWIVPDSHKITEMTIHPSSSYVRVMMRGKELNISFQYIGDARLYAEIYRLKNSRISFTVPKDKDALQQMMPQPVRR